LNRKGIKRLLKIYNSLASNIFYRRPKSLRNRRYRLVRSFIIELANGQKKLIGLILALNIFSALFEGSTLAILLLSVQLLNPSESLENVGAYKQFDFLITWLQGNFQPGVIFLFLVFLAVFSQILRSGFQFFSVAAVAVLQFRLQGKLEVRCFRQMLEISHSDFNQYGIGRMLTYMSDTKNSAYGVSVLNEILAGLLLLLIYSVALVNISWQGTVAALVILSSISLALKTVVSRIQEVSQRLFQVTSRLNQNLTEWISGAYLIRAFSQDEEAIEAFRKITFESRQATCRGKILQATLNPLIHALTALLLGSGLLIGYLLLGNQLGQFLPQLLLFFFILNRLAGKVGSISNSRGSLASRQPSIEYLAEFLRKDNKTYLLDQGYPFTNLETGIDFKSVSLLYPGSESLAIENFSCTLLPGQVTALVGFSGAGKSTVVDLVLRLYDPTQGHITVNQRDLRQLSLRQWRKRIGIVAQETFIFNASVRENIRFSKPDASDEEVVKAAKIAYAHDFILSLEAQYETVIGDRGYRLSGGQRQRLAIARAVLREPELLIMDEATSSLDSESERLVQQAINGLKGTVTMLVVAHRLSTIKGADQIVVMKNGKMVENGKHQALLDKNRYYAHLWRLQTQQDSLS